MNTIEVKGVQLDVTDVDICISPLFQLTTVRYDNFQRDHHGCNKDISKLLSIKSVIRTIQVRVNPKARKVAQHYIRKECVRCVLNYINDDDITKKVLEQLGTLHIVGHDNGILICDDRRGWICIESHSEKNKQFRKYLPSQQAKDLMRTLDIGEPVYKKFGMKWTHPILYKSYRMWCDTNYAMEVLCQAPNPTETLTVAFKKLDINNGRAKPGVIYFIGFEDDPTDKHIKIGRTCCPIEKRLTQLQCGHPVRKIKLIKFIPTDDVLTAEKEYHDRYDQYRTNGEWFTLPDDIKQSLDQLCCNGRNCRFSGQY